MSQKQTGWRPDYDDAEAIADARDRERTPAPMNEELPKDVVPAENSNGEKPGSRTEE